MPAESEQKKLNSDHVVSKKRSFKKLLPLGLVFVLCVISIIIISILFPPAGMLLFGLMISKLAVTITAISLSLIIGGFLLYKSISFGEPKKEVLSEAIPLVIKKEIPEVEVVKSFSGIYDELKDNRERKKEVSDKDTSSSSRQDKLMSIIAVRWNEVKGIKKFQQDFKKILNSINFQNNNEILSKLDQLLKSNKIRLVDKWHRECDYTYLEMILEDYPAFFLPQLFDILINHFQYYEVEDLEKAVDIINIFFETYQDSKWRISSKLEKIKEMIFKLYFEKAIGVTSSEQKKALNKLETMLKVPNEISVIPFLEPALKSKNLKLIKIILGDLVKVSSSKDSETKEIKYSSSYRTEFLVIAINIIEKTYDSIQSELDEETRDFLIHLEKSKGIIDQREREALVREEAEEEHSDEEKGKRRQSFFIPRPLPVNLKTGEKNSFIPMLDSVSEEDESLKSVPE